MICNTSMIIGSHPKRFIFYQELSFPKEFQHKNCSFSDGIPQRITIFDKNNSLFEKIMIFGEKLKNFSVGYINHTSVSGLPNTILFRKSTMKKSIGRKNNVFFRVRHLFFS